MWEAYQEWRHTRQGAGDAPQRASSARRRRSAGGCASSRPTGVDQVILLAQAGRTPHEDICASLELFAREVMPEFHAREPEHARWKADVLAGRVDLDALDTEALQALRPPERGHRAAHPGGAEGEDGRQGTRVSALGLPALAWLVFVGAGAAGGGRRRHRSPRPARRPRRRDRLPAVSCWPATACS